MRLSMREPGSGSASGRLEGETAEFKSMKTKVFELSVIVLAAAASLAFMLAGCSGRHEAWYAGIHDLNGVVSSADLQPALQAALAALAGPEPAGKAVADLDLYNDLMLRIQRPATREEAGDRLYALWEGESTNFDWIELAINYDYLLHRTADLERICSRPELSDTTSAIAAFVAGRRLYGHGERGQLYRRAEAGVAGLDSLQRVWLAVKLAIVDNDGGDSLGAVRRLLEAAPLARAVAGSRLEVILWRGIAGDLSRVDRQDDALHASVLATAMARKVGYDYRVLQGRIQLAGIMHRRREVTGALTLYEECAGIAAEREYPWLVSFSLDQAAGVAAELGDYRRALALDLRNLDHGLALNDSLNVPRSMASVAHDYRVLGQLDSCRVYLERARPWVEAFPDRRNKARLPALAAQLYCQLGDFAMADSLLAVARGLSPGTGTAADEARLLLELIRNGLEMGQPDPAYRAIARLQELRGALQDRGPDQNLRADFEIATADLLARQGEFRLAAEAQARAAEAVQAGGGEGKAWELARSRGELALLREDLGTARAAFATCVELSEKSGDPDLLATSRFHLGQVLLEQGEFAAARALFAREDPDPAFGPRFRTRLSTLLFQGVSYAREGRHTEAIPCYRRALALCTPNSPSDLVARLHIELGRSLAAAGSAAKAEASLLEAKEMLRRPREEVTSELRAFNDDALRDAAEVLIGLYAAQPALLQGKALGRHTLLLAQGSLAPDARPGDLAQGPEAALRRLQGEAGSPALVFFVGRGTSFRWTISGRSCEVRRLPGRAELRQRLATVLADMEQPDRPVDAAAAAQLADTLLGSLDGIWAEGRVLRIVPDGLLSAVPWSALPLPGADPSLGRLVADQGPVVEAPRLAAFRLAAAGKPARTCTLLAIGCDGLPAGRPQDDAPPVLHRAEEEASRIAALWPDDRVVLRTGSAASWGRLAGEDLHRFGVIHIASHALVQQGLPGRSTLRLASGDAQDVLTIPAVSRLRLDAQLVYLSCCEAARRLAVSGGGVADFAGAFLEAGAHTVIASTIWVDDEAAAFLAGRFYRHWLEGMSRAEALRAARLDTRRANERWRHPCYWAFFRLMGDAS